MRERLFLIGSIAVLLLLLVGLNAASYVQVEREPELEFRPDRSTYNAGATGTRALYEYLAETGQHVVRWREPIAALGDAKRRRPDTFVVVGRLRVPYTKEETLKLRQWVAAGGRLVVIDRTADAQLLPPAATARAPDLAGRRATTDRQRDEATADRHRHERADRHGRDRRRADGRSETTTALERARLLIYGRARCARRRLRGRARARHGR